MTTAVFYADADDGYMESASNVDYNVPWDTGTATIHDTENDLHCGQGYIPGAWVPGDPPYLLPPEYFMKRLAVYFDTSTIPVEAIIDSATLSFKLSAEQTWGNDFDIVLQRGILIGETSRYPHKPLAAGSYYRLRYSGDGGSINTVGFNGSAAGTAVDIPLNETGLTWIQKGVVEAQATTKFMLRSSDDISGTPVEEGVFVTFYSYEVGSPNIPYLTVDYHLTQHCWMRL